MKPYAIVNRGRGPEIADSRITVYDVLAETRAGATAEELAELYGLEVEQIRLALRYIEEHSDEVERNWLEIQQRHARGNPPEIVERFAASRAKLLARLDDLRKRTASARENGDARDSG